MRYKSEYKSADILVSGNKYVVFYPMVIDGKLDYKLTKDTFESKKDAKDFIDIISCSGDYPTQEEINSLVYGVEKKI